MGAVDDKRAANLAANEEAKKKKNEEIKARKAEMAAKRADEANAKGAAEEAAAKKRQEAAEKREQNIKAKEAARAEKAKYAPAAPSQEASSKYSKKDVIELKKVFDEYDTDGDGQMKLSEFKKKLSDKKAQAAPRPGQKSTLQERKATEGVSLVDLSESVFHEIDLDGNGEVSFEELCKLFFKHASKQELATMLSWVQAKPEPEPEPEPTLSAEAKAEIKKIFKLYDKDKSGSLSKKELVDALKATEMAKEEIYALFGEHDTNGDEMITSDEFEKLMESTGAFC